MNSTQVVQNISFLYELSMSIGKTLDWREGVVVFLRTLMARKNLSFAALWLSGEWMCSEVPEKSSRLICAYATPECYQTTLEIGATNPMLLRLQAERAINASDMEVEILLPGPLRPPCAGSGLFAVGENGFLLLCSPSYDAFYSEVFRRQLRPVIRKFAVTLEGAFCHKYLQQEIEKRSEIAEKLRWQVELQTIIGSISRDFVRVSPGNADSVFHRTLERLGQFVQVDRSYLFFFNPERQTMSNAFEWCAAGIEPQIAKLQEVPCSLMPWWMGKMLSNEDICIENVAAMSDDKKEEKEFLLSQAVQSLIAVPLYSQGALFGFLGFDAVRRSCQWRTEWINLLHVVAEMMATLIQRNRTQAMIEKLSIHDGLTGLYNRAYFEAEMCRHKREKSSLGCMVCDLDGLKAINDIMGHAQGDITLQEAAEALRGCCGENVVAARIGGDEFAVLVAGACLELMEEMSRELKQSVAALHKRHPQSLLRLSVGIAAGDGSELPEQVFRNADNAMYRDKMRNKKTEKDSIMTVILSRLAERGIGSDPAWSGLAGSLEAMAVQLRLPEEMRGQLFLLAKYRDIGNISLPENLVNKKGKLTEAESELLRSHCESGYRISQSIPELMPIAEWILKHHEVWDGSGYPLGLKENSIPLACRLLRVAEVFESMTAGNGFEEKMTREDALREIEQYSGVQFDPGVVSIFGAIQRSP